MKELPKFLFALREDLKDEKQFLPTRAEPLATGWDVRAAFSDRKPKVLYPNEYILIPLGFRVFCPENWWLELRPRSSTFSKKHLHCLYGVIDQDFEGQLLFAGQFLPDVRALGSSLTIEFGQSIGQILPFERQNMNVQEISEHEIEEMFEKRNTPRKSGGFGSTDAKNQ